MPTQTDGFITRPRRQIPKTGQTTPYQTGGDGTYQKGYAPTPRFVALGDGTVRDNATGLVWIADPSAVETDADRTVIEDCEDLWDDGVATSSLDTGVVGTNSIKLANPVTTTGIMATEAIPSIDLSAYSGVILYIKTSVNLANNDISFMIDEDAGCVSPSETIAIPALTAAAGWTRVALQFASTTLTTRDAIISVGFKMNVNMAQVDFYADDIRISKWGLTATPLKMTWPNAILACEALTYAGQSDWRMPNVKELFLLLDGAAITSTVLNALGFSNLTSANHWTSTTYFTTTTSALVCNFTLGTAGAGGKTITLLPVLPVRGG